MESKGLSLTTLSEIEKFSIAISKAVDFLPKHIQKLDANQRPWAIMAAIQLGSELGLSPMSAINNIAVVYGVPTLWGDMMLGLVIASGELEYIEESSIGEGDGYTATCKVKRKGFKNEVVEKFSIEDAKRAGLWTKAGTWQTHPRRMLKYKARSFALRDLFADILKGLHSTEEMEGESLGTSRPMPSANVSDQPLLSEKEQAAIMGEIMGVIDAEPLPNFKINVQAAIDKHSAVLTTRQDHEIREYANATYIKLKEFEKIDREGIIEFKPNGGADA